MKLARSKGSVVIEETGEIVSREQQEKHDYIMTYLDALVRLTTGMKIQTDVLFELLKLKGRKDNIIFLSTTRKKAIAEKLNVSIGHISVVLDKLCKSKVFARIGRAEFLVSPYCFANVGWDELIKLKIVFDSVSKDTDGVVSESKLSAELSKNELKIEAV